MKPIDLKNNENHKYNKYKENQNNKIIVKSLKTNPKRES